jgi:heme/copper-type cytochrome/quinol oxidase subunit 1
LVAGLALAGVVATILASLPYLIAGFAGQPARTPVFSTSGPMGLWNALVLVGHVLMAVVVLGALALLARSFFSGGDDSVGDDPFDAQTIEWTTTSPAPPNNYPEVPTVTSAEPLTDLKTHSTVGSPS